MNNQQATQDIFNWMQVKEGKKLKGTEPPGFFERIQNDLATSFTCCCSKVSVHSIEESPQEFKNPQIDPAAIFAKMPRNPSLTSSSRGLMEGSTANLRKRSNASNAHAFLKSAK